MVDWKNNFGSTLKMQFFVANPEKIGVFLFKQKIAKASKLPQMP